MTHESNDLICPSASMDDGGVEHLMNWRENTNLNPKRDASHYSYLSRHFESGESFDDVEFSRFLSSAKFSQLSYEVVATVATSRTGTALG